jgi:hypothetical protein
MSAARPVDEPSPYLGEHNFDVYRQLGLDEGELGERTGYGLFT